MYSYIVKIRGKVYVWGSSGLKINLKYPLLLTINNDLVGDIVTLSSEKTTGSPAVLGTLGPGECWTLPLDGLRGVFATCTTDTTLACLLFAPHQSAITPAP